MGGDSNVVSRVVRRFDSWERSSKSIRKWRGGRGGRGRRRERREKMVPTVTIVVLSPLLVGEHLLQLVPWVSSGPSNPSR